MKKNGLLHWIDARFPLSKTWKKHASEYYTPKNFNFWYYFGALALLVLIIQLMSGIFLTMHYKPSATQAFASVEYIMREVPFGWLLRYMHSTGASAFFIVVYLHMFKAILYGSYKKPRELLWLLGMAIYVLLMAEAFMGYLLPWGQMSFWGAKVITSLFEALPVIGPDLVVWLRGGSTIADPTLNRFFALHVIAIPLMLLFVVYLHIIALHEVGSNNPDGIDIKKTTDQNGIPLDGAPFYPYFVVKDLVGVGVFLIVFCSILFFMPDFGGLFLEAANFEMANPMKTPEHITPVWYMTPYYAMLRAIPSKLGGVLTMSGAIAILFILPWLDRSSIKSIRYRSLYFKIALCVFVVSFIALGYLGMLSVTPMKILIARILTFCYFAFFISLPFYTPLENSVKFRHAHPIPTRLT